MTPAVAIPMTMPVASIVAVVESSCEGTSGVCGEEERNVGNGEEKRSSWGQRSIVFIPFATRSHSRQPQHRHTLPTAVHDTKVMRSWDDVSHEFATVLVPHSGNSPRERSEWPLIQTLACAEHTLVKWDRGEGQRKGAVERTN